MLSNPPAGVTNALDHLRHPIESFVPKHTSDKRFQSSMLDLADLLEELWSDDEDETLESDVVSSVLYAFPALTVPGPAPEALVEQIAGGRLIAAETADLLHTLATVRRTLSEHRPPGFSAALCRAVLVAIFGAVELLVLIDGDRGAERCFELLDAVEATADRFSGAA